MSDHLKCPKCGSVLAVEEGFYEVVNEEIVCPICYSDFTLRLSTSAGFYLEEFAT